jgi:hypothetical protein
MCAYAEAIRDAQLTAETKATTITSTADAKATTSTTVEANVATAIESESNDAAAVITVIGAEISSAEMAIEEKATTFAS